MVLASCQEIGAFRGLGRTGQMYRVPNPPERSDFRTNWWTALTQFAKRVALLIAKGITPLTRPRRYQPSDIWRNNALKCNTLYRGNDFADHLIPSADNADAGIDPQEMERIARARILGF